MGKLPYAAAWLGIALAVLGLILVGAAQEGSSLYTVSGLVTLLSWLLVPLGGYFDIRHVRKQSWWQPDGPAWTAHFLIPFWGPVMFVVYAFFRHERIEEMKPPVSALPKARQPDPHQQRPPQRQQRQRQEQQRSSQQTRQQAQKQTQRRQARRGK